MKCENAYCIYNRGFECLLDEVSIDSLGLCSDCITVSLDKKYLEAEKERQLRDVEER